MLKAAALTEDRFSDPNLTWNSLPDVTLDYNEQHEFELGQVDSSKWILFSMDLQPTGGGDPPTTEIYQFSVAEAEQVPTLTVWGLVMLGLVLMAVAGVTLVRRRAGVPA